jgi:NAD(P)-dependent dehydrogenase (short-subunit alcohol dehydrogenase family)
MPVASGKTVLIVGVGEGLSASLARRAAAENMRVVLAARRTDKLATLVKETGAQAHSCDAANDQSVARLFEMLAVDAVEPDWVVYNPSYRVRGSLITLDPEEVRKTLMVSCFGGFLVGRHAAEMMLRRGSGAIFFTGASASVRGYANSAAFAMGKFGLRGLAQSMARELAPKNIHVAHFVIDGGIRRPGSDARAAERGEDGLLEPDRIAETYFHLFHQHRSAWTWEVELRPWVERF